MEFWLRIDLKMMASLSSGYTRPVTPFPAAAISTSTKHARSW